MLGEDFGVHANKQLAGMGLCCSPPVIAEYLMTERAKSELERADGVIIESPVSGRSYWVVTAAGLEGFNPADCEGDDHQQCLKDSLAEYKENVEEIFSLLTEAVHPSETLIRGVDAYAFFMRISSPLTRCR